MHIPLPHAFVFASFAASLSGAVLLDEKFDNPTELTYSFPSPPGVTPTFHGDFSGWSKGGIITLNYGSGLGSNGSGGMLCTVEKPSTEFMQVTYQKIALPFSDPTYLAKKHFSSYQVEFDAKIPAGKIFTLYLAPQGPKDMAPRAWNSRLVLGKVVGTGSYTRYVFPASAASDQSVTSFFQFIRDAFLNGTEKMEVSIVWLFALKDQDQSWAAGEYFQLDNIKLTTDS